MILRTLKIVILLIVDKCKHWNTIHVLPFPRFWVNGRSVGKSTLQILVGFRLDPFLHFPCKEFWFLDEISLESSSESVEYSDILRTVSIHLLGKHAKSHVESYCR